MEFSELMIDKTVEISELKSEGLINVISNRNDTD